MFEQLKDYSLISLRSLQNRRMRSWLTIIGIVICLGVIFLVPSVRNFLLKAQLTVITEKKKQTSLRHLSIIMDGNRRWAKDKGLPTLEGHMKGYKKITEAVDWLFNRGVKVISVFAFSTLNIASYVGLFG